MFDLTKADARQKAIYDRLPASTKILVEEGIHDVEQYAYVLNDKPAPATGAGVPLPAKQANDSYLGLIDKSVGGTIEKGAGQITRYAGDEAPSDLVNSLSSIITGLANMGAQGHPMAPSRPDQFEAADVRVPMIGEEKGLGKRMADRGEARLQDVERQRAERGIEHGWAGGPAGMVLDISQNPDALAGMAGGLLTKTGIGAPIGQALIAIPTLRVGANTYYDQLDQGVDKEDAKARAAAAMGIEWATESLGFGAAAKATQGVTAVGTKIAKGFATEAAEETAADAAGGGLDNIISVFAEGKSAVKEAADQNKFKSLEDAAARLSYSAALGGIMGAGLRGVTAPFETASEIRSFEQRAADMLERGRVAADLQYKLAAGKDINVEAIAGLEKPTATPVEEVPDKAKQEDMAYAQNEARRQAIRDQGFQQAEAEKQAEENPASLAGPLAKAGLDKLVPAQSGELTHPDKALLDEAKIATAVGEALNKKEADSLAAKQKKAMDKARADRTKARDAEATRLGKEIAAKGLAPEVYVEGMKKWNKENPLPTQEQVNATVAKPASKTPAKKLTKKEESKIAVNTVMADMKTKLKSESVVEEEEGDNKVDELTSALKGIANKQAADVKIAGTPIPRSKPVPRGSRTINNPKKDLKATMRNQTKDMQPREMNALEAGIKSGRILVVPSGFKLPDGEIMGSSDGVYDGEKIYINQDSLDAGARIMDIANHEVDHYFKHSEQLTKGDVKKVLSGKVNVNSSIEKIEKLAAGRNAVAVKAKASATSAVKRAAAKGSTKEEQDQLYKEELIAYFHQEATAASRKGTLASARSAFQDIVSSLKGSKLDEITDSQYVSRKRLENLALATIKKGERLESFGGSKARGFDEAKKKGDTIMGTDGKERFYIDNNLGTFKPAVWNAMKTGSSTDLENIWNDPKLFEAYPQLKKLKFHKYDLKDNSGGYMSYPQFAGSLPAIHVNERYAMGYDSITRTMLHEIQHVIQDIEGFASGTNTEDAMTQLKNEAFRQIVNVLEDPKVAAKVNDFVAKRLGHDDFDAMTDEVHNRDPKDKNKSVWNRLIELQQPNLLRARRAMTTRFLLTTGLISDRIPDERIATALWNHEMISEEAARLRYMDHSGEREARLVEKMYDDKKVGAGKLYYHEIMELDPATWAATEYRVNVQGKGEYLRKTEKAKTGVPARMESFRQKGEGEINGYNYNDWADDMWYGRGSYKTPWDDLTPGRQAGGPLWQQSYKDNHAKTMWVQKITKRYLDRYAGTPEDPLNDVVLPDGERWEDVMDASVSSKDFEGKTIHTVSVGNSPIRNYLSHVMDYINENVGRDELQKYDFVRAVKETVADDAKKAKLADKARVKADGNLTVHTEYADGTRWVQLDKPGQFAGESDIMGHSVRGYEPPSRTTNFDADQAFFKEAGFSLDNISVGGDSPSFKLRKWKTDEYVDPNSLSPELKARWGKLGKHSDWTEASGDSGHANYGHGGWEGIKSGKAKVYSLRDKDGRSHVTIEVDRKVDTESAIKLYETETGNSWSDNSHGWNRPAPDYHRWEILNAHKLDYKDSITQIKGKGNTKPAEKYMPYIHDFLIEYNPEAVHETGQMFDSENIGRIHPISGPAYRESKLTLPAKRKSTRLESSRDESSTPSTLKRLESRNFMEERAAQLNQEHEAIAEELMRLSRDTRLRNSIDDFNKITAPMLLRVESLLNSVIPLYRSTFLESSVDITWTVNRAKELIGYAEEAISAADFERHIANATHGTAKNGEEILSNLNQYLSDAREYRKNLNMRSSTQRREAEELDSVLPKDSVKRLESRSILESITLDEEGNSFVQRRKRQLGADKDSNVIYKQQEKLAIREQAESVAERFQVWFARHKPLLDKFGSLFSYGNDKLSLDDEEQYRKTKQAIFDSLVIHDLITEKLAKIEDEPSDLDVDSVSSIHGNVQYLAGKLNQFITNEAASSIEQLRKVAGNSTSNVVSFKRLESRSNDQTETPEFKEWFGDSVVVDEDGNPKRMYTGTSKDKDFPSFNVPRNGAWFTDDPEGASMYAKDNDSQGLKLIPGTWKYQEVNSASRVIPVYLSIKKPYTLTAADRDRMNVDNYKRAQGIIFDELRYKGYDGVDMGGGTWAVLGEPTQIKSAIGNKGNFNPKKKNILESRSDSLESRSGPSPVRTFFDATLELPGVRTVMGVFSTAGKMGRVMREMQETAAGISTEYAIVAEANFNDLTKALQEAEAVDPNYNWVQFWNRIENERDADQRERIVNAMSRDFPEVARSYRMFRDSIDNMTDLIVMERAKTLDERPFDDSTEEGKAEIALYAKLIENKGRYTTRAYLLSKGQTGKLYGELSWTAYQKAMKAVKEDKDINPQDVLAATRVANAMVYYREALRIPDELPINERLLRDLYTAWFPNSGGTSQKKMREDLARKRETLNQDEIDAEVTLIIQEILGVTPARAGFLASRIRGEQRDNTIMLSRQDVPKVIRELMGEIENAPLKMMMTLTAQANYVAKTRLFAEIAFHDDLAILPADRHKKGNEKFTEYLTGPQWGSLSGRYVTIRTREILSEQVTVPNTLRDVIRLMGKNPGPGGAAALAWLGTGWGRVSAVAKGFKIMGNIMGYVFNIVGNGFNLVRAGFNLHPKYMARAVGVARQMIMSKGLRDVSDDTRTMNRMQVLDSAQIGELKVEALDILRDEVYAQTKPGDRAYSFRRNVRAKLGTIREVYAMTDVVSKIANAMYMIDQYREFHELNGDDFTEAQIERIVADRIKDENVTFSRSMPLLRAIESKGLTWFGTYIGETFRTQIWNAVNILDEIGTAKNAKTEEARKHMAGIAARHAIGSIMSTVMVTTMLQAIADAAGGDDEWKRFLPTWAQIGSPLTMGVNKDGNPLMLTLSRFDPVGPVIDILRAAQKGQITDLDDMKAVFLDLYVAPTVGRAVVDRLTADTETQKGKASLRIIESFFPATAVNWFKYDYPQGNDGMSNLGKAVRLIGGRLEEADPQKAINEASRTFGDIQKRGRKDLYNSLSEGDTSQFLDRLESYRAEEAKAFKQLVELDQALVKIGKRPRDRRTIMTDANLSVAVTEMVIRGQNMDAKHSTLLSLRSIKESLKGSKLRDGNTEYERMLANAKATKAKLEKLGYRFKE